MTNSKLVMFLVMPALLTGSAAAQETGSKPPAKPASAPAAAPAKPPAAKPAGPVDMVIEQVKAGTSEGMIIRILQKQNKPVDLTLNDLGRLKNAKVSEGIINALMDPAGSSAPKPPAAPAVVVPPQSAVATAATAPPTAPAPPPVAPQPAAQTTPVTTTAASTPPPPSVPAQAPDANAVKKRVIVDAFDYSTVRKATQEMFKTDKDIGKGIRALLQTRLTKQAKVIVVERDKIKLLEAEQDRNQGNRVKQGSGARTGQIAGADALLTGDIVAFGRDDRKISAAGGGIIGGGIGAVGGMFKKDKAVVVISYRLVDAETSELIATGEARGESVRSSKGFGALAGALGKGLGGVEIDMTSSNFAETIIGEATIACVDKLAEILNTQSEAMKKKARPVEAMVADVAGNSLTITAGSNDTVNVADVFEIHRVLREVTDPVTKEVLDRITEKVGELTITNVRDKIAFGAYNGTPSKVGDVARKKL